MEAGQIKEITQAVKAEANRLGFTLVGVTSPEPPYHWDTYLAWLEAGRHGEMAYLASQRSLERRANPRQILPECRSILVVGAPYPQGFLEGGEDGLDPGGKIRQLWAGQPAEQLVAPTWRGRSAAYAWGSDYHDVLPKRLKALVEFIERLVGATVPNRWYTDSGPVLERELAQRAGLGWLGKNTCLIHPHQGSYFLLAELLLGIPLEIDPPFTADHCGTCTRCIDACPTDCILPDRTLDARRCVSYLTIELKGPIPIELRPQIGGWVFGCDICQQVCPWNVHLNASNAAPQSNTEFAPRPTIAQPDLLEIMVLTPAVFNQRFKGSPVKRTKRRGYLRNAAVALGNQAAGSCDHQVVHTLAKALFIDSEALVRGHAAWALGRVGGSVARQALQQALQSEKDSWVATEIQTALQECTE